MNRKRQLWWQCEHSHTRAIDAQGAARSREQFGQFLVGIEREHAKLYPLCPAHMIRLAPKKQLLDRDDVALQWAIDHARLHLNFEGRQESRIVLN